MVDEPIKFFCEQCGQKIGVARGLSGVTIRCPSCGQPTTVPADRARTIDMESAGEPSSTAPTSPETPAARLPAAPAPAPGPFAGLPPEPGVIAQAGSQGSGLATASLICGILSIVPFLCVGWIVGLPAILLGILALQRDQPRALAIAGIITGGIGTLIGGLVTAILAIPWFMNAMQGPG